MDRHSRFWPVPYIDLETKIERLEERLRNRPNDVPDEAGLMHLTPAERIEYHRDRDDRLVVARFHKIMAELRDILSPYEADPPRADLVKEWITAVLAHVSGEKDEWPFLLRGRYYSSLYEFLKEIKEEQHESPPVLLLPRLSPSDWLKRRKLEFGMIRASVPDYSFHTDLQHDRIDQLRAVIKSSNRIPADEGKKWLLEVVKLLIDTKKDAEALFTESKCFYAAYDRAWLFAHHEHDNLPAPVDLVNDLRKHAGFPPLDSRTNSRHSHTSSSLAHRVVRRNGRTVFPVLQQAYSSHRRRFS